MKLYDLPYGTKVQLKDKEGNTLDLTFHYIDGSSAYCVDNDGNPIHVAMWADVEVIDEVTP